MDPLHFDETLLSGQISKCDNEETSVPPHETNLQITHKNHGDSQSIKFAKGNHQGNGEDSGSVFNRDQVRHESVKPLLSNQSGDQFPADSPTIARSLGSEETLVSCNTTQTASTDSGGNTDQQTSNVNALDSKVRLPSDSLSITCSIQDCETLMSIDNGASVTAVSNTFLSTLPTPPTLLASSLPSVRTVSCEQLPVLGHATLSFLIGNRTYTSTALVIDNLTYPVVLGRDFLTQFGSVIDLQGHILTLGTTNVVPLQSSFPVVGSTPEESTSVHAHATFILPPLSESVIPVYPKSGGKTGLTEHNTKLAERYQVCGYLSSSVYLNRCSTMGTFIPAAGSMSVIDTDKASGAPILPQRDDETAPLDLTSSTLDFDQLTQLKALIAEYRDIFALKPEELGRTGLVQHRIDTGDHPPVRQRPHRVSDTQRGIIEEHVDDMLNRGIIQLITSPWASPIILVKKKDGTDRFVVDFRRLNAVTRKDSFPLPRIDGALDALNGIKYFSSMNLRVVIGRLRWSLNFVNARRL